MNSRARWVRLAVGGVVAMMIAAVLGGCGDGGRRVQFRQELVAGVEALQVGDLDVADGHIAAAGKQAIGRHEKRQVASLTDLSTGARAMMIGDAATAKREWSQIADPRLNRQVRIQAESVMNMQVSMTAEAEVEQ